jgi:hypothetical protein
MKIFRNAGFIFLLILAVPLAINALSYGNFDITYGFLQLKKQAIETGWYLPAYYAHVLAAGLILLIGIFQLHPTWGLRWRQLHRALGKTLCRWHFIFLCTRRSGDEFFSSTGARGC